jgi:hypothetical protein
MARDHYAIVTKKPVAQRRNIRLAARRMLDGLLDDPALIRQHGLNAVAAVTVERELRTGDMLPAN